MHDLPAAVARMFCIGFPGLVPPDDTRRLIDRGVAGVIFFSRNIESRSQFQKLTASLKTFANRPLLTCIDQEGGRVQRLRDGFTSIPSMRTIGAQNDESLARDVGQLLAHELRSVNIDLNFAPVLDVDSNPANPVIADRSFGPDPDLVFRLGCALIDGMQQNGVAACGKHFPGHGDTSQDSHLALPTLPHSLDRLNEIELPPFRAAIRAGVASIMTAHVIFQPLDQKYPATLSRPALDGILRDQMHFNGVVISDDLEMKAIADHYGLEESVIRAANAGVDLFLVCHNADVQNRAIDLLIKAVRAGQVPESRITEANRRLDALFNQYVKPANTAPAPIDPVIPKLIASFNQSSLGHDPTESLI